MVAALVTAITLSFGALIAATVYGHLAISDAGILRHTTLSLFAVLLTLLSHSMLLFYLIGKGRAIREAVAEGGLSRDPVVAFARVRGPVFSIATLSMLVTMAAGIVGGGVVTGSVARWVHVGLAYLALAANAVTLRAELHALREGARIVADIDRRLGLGSGGEAHPSPGS
jgi:hypothetical protein